MSSRQIFWKIFTVGFESFSCLVILTRLRVAIFISKLTHLYAIRCLWPAVGHKVLDWWNSTKRYITNVSMRLFHMKFEAVHEDKSMYITFVWGNIKCIDYVLLQNCLALYSTTAEEIFRNSRDFSSTAE